MFSDQKAGVSDLGVAIGPGAYVGYSRLRLRVLQGSMVVCMSFVKLDGNPKPKP